MLARGLSQKRADALVQLLAYSTLQIMEVESLYSLLQAHAGCLYLVLYGAARSWQASLVSVHMTTTAPMDLNSLGL